MATFVATGLVESREVQVASEVPARVDSLQVDEGASVRRGQLLAVLDAKEARARVQGMDEQLVVSSHRVQEAESALALEETQGNASERQAEAQLEAARLTLEKLQNGATREELRMAQERVREAGSPRDYARSHEKRVREMYQAGYLSRNALDEAKSQAKAADARYNQAQEGLRQVQRGARSEDVALARQQVGQMAAALDMARGHSTRLEMLRATLAQARAAHRQQQAALRAAQADLDKYRIRATADATVGRKLVEAGEFASPGRPLLTLVDLGKRWVRAEVDEEDAGLVQMGQEVAVTSGAFPGRTFQGSVEDIAPTVVQKPDSAVRSRILRVKVVLTDPEGLLRPGMECNVEGKKKAGEGVLVAREALIRHGPRTTVWKLGHDSVVRQIEVGVGPTNFVDAIVLNGLDRGDRVVVGSVDGLKDGLRVNVAR